MFGNHHLITQLAGAFAIASVAAVVAVSSAAAGTSSSDRTRGQACQTTATSWRVVTDDLGIPWLEPVGLEACTDRRVCATCRPDAVAVRAGSPSSTTSASRTSPDPGRTARPSPRRAPFRPPLPPPRPWQRKRP